jgi:phosphoethanolamine N-methyltransferase
MESALASAGLQDITSRDRNAWYATVCADELAQIEGPLKQQLLDAVGEEIYANWLQVRRGLKAAVAAGGLRPTHLRGFKPGARAIQSADGRR